MWIELRKTCSKCGAVEVVPEEEISEVVYDYFQGVQFEDSTALCSDCRREFHARLEAITDSYFERKKALRKEFGIGKVDA